LRVADRLPPSDEVRGFFDAGLFAFIIGMQVELRGAVPIHAFLDFVAQKADIEVFRLTDKDWGQHSICRLFDVDEIAGRSSFHVGTPWPDVIPVCRPRLANPFDRLVYLYAHKDQGLIFSKPAAGFTVGLSLCASHEWIFWGASWTNAPSNNPRHDEVYKVPIHPFFGGWFRTMHFLW
jgi:hypothetical protein